MTEDAGRDYRAWLYVIHSDNVPRLQAVTIERAGVFLDDLLSVKSADYVGAIIEQQNESGACVVRLLSGPRPFCWLLFSVATPQDAFDVVRALGLAPEQRALAYADRAHLTGLVLSTLSTAFALLVLAFVAIDRAGWHLPEKVLLACVVVLAVGGTITSYFFRISEVVLGLDGIVIRRWRRTRFVSYDEVAKLTREPRKPMALVLHDGEKIPLIGALGWMDQRTIGDLLYGRAWQGVYGRSHDYDYAKRRSSEDVPTVARVRSLKTGGENGGYRVAPAVPAAVEDALVDSTESLDTRVAAAIALRAKGGENAAKRIREVANASASPKVRVLFERIADDAAAEEIAEHMDAVTPK